MAGQLGNAVGSHRKLDTAVRQPRPAVAARSNYQIRPTASMVLARRMKPAMFATQPEDPPRPSNSIETLRNLHIWDCDALLDFHGLEALNTLTNLRIHDNQSLGSLAGLPGLRGGSDRHLGQSKLGLAA
jgi:hypothetical protein